MLPAGIDARPPTAPGGSLTNSHSTSGHPPPPWVSSRCPVLGAVRPPYPDTTTFCTSPTTQDTSLCCAYTPITLYACPELASLSQPGRYWGTCEVLASMTQTPPNRRLHSPLHTGPHNQHVTDRAAEQPICKWGYCGVAAALSCLGADDDPLREEMASSVRATRMPHGKNGWMNDRTPALQQEWKS